MFAPTERLHDFICMTLAVLTLFCLPVADVAAQSQRQLMKSGFGGNYAIIIPVATFSHLKPEAHLPFTLNDADHLSRTLKERGSFNINMLSEKSPISGQTPTKKNIEEKLPLWLSQYREEDTVIVYVSTHGFSDETNRHVTYIMPSDYNPQIGATTAIPASWLRKELGKCKAKTKLLLIDACHAGGESDASPGTWSNGRASELAQYGDEEEDLKNVFVIASSTKDERSYLFPKKNLSLFSYWLNEGFKGHADSDCNGAISIDELYNYTYRNVIQTAEKIGVQQTPVRIVRTGTPGVPELMESKPITLDSLLDQIADQMAMAMDIYGQKQTGVPEFTVNSGAASLLGREKYGLLSTYCADEVERRLKSKLSQMGYDDYQVVPREKLQSALKERNIDAAKLEGIVKGVPEPSAKYAATGDEMGVPSIILGTLRDRNRADVHIQCELIDVGSHKTINAAGGLAALTENEWAMLGRSMTVRPTDRRDRWDDNVETLDTTGTTSSSYVPSAMPGSTGESVPNLPSQVAPVTSNAAVIDLWDERSETLHPQFQPDSDFQLEIAVKRPGTNLYQVRPIRNVGGQAVVTLRKGEIYQIRLRNKLPGNVGARVLVDGLNTIPESISGAKAKFDAVDGDPPDLEIGPRVNLAHARFWIILPTPRAWTTINGFFRNTGAQGSYHEFRVTDAPNSLAAQKEFTEEIGIITVAFYELREGPGVSRGFETNVGTEPGPVKQQPIEERANVSTGNLLAVFHIHYTAQ